jgi:hypothetical protein
MAREESDREDLLREATALVERIELRPANGTAAAGHADAAESIVIGFRANGAISFFFGADPVYQFNAAGELRRAYCDGLLFKAVRGRLVSLERVRTQNEVQLLKRELSDDDQTAFVARMRQRLVLLNQELNSGSLEIVGQVPQHSDILGRVRSWLAEHDATAIADSPRV